MNHGKPIRAYHDFCSYVLAFKKLESQ
ncbi:hypothetical protein D043_2309A, partial [Vibrio parahaemolyticus EKP-021]